jgi:ferredoxin-NADP reductase
MTDAGNPAPPAPAPARRPALRARIERVYDHCADTRSLWLRTTSGALPRFAPGMFISIAIPLAEGARVRPYSIASSAEDGEPFEICFNRVPNGAGAAWLFERATGDELEFTGPFGAFTLDRPPEAETIFIAESTGVAPIRPMARRALADRDGVPIHLIYAADRAEHLLYRDEFERIARERPRFRFEPRVIPAATLWDELGRIVQTRWLDADAVRIRNFYICGVGKGVLALRDRLRAGGYERRSVRYEQW